MFGKKTYEQKIKTATSWKQLCQIIIDLEVIPGSNRNYDYMEMISLLYMLKTGEAVLNNITRTFGLRDKAQELLYIDSIAYNTDYLKRALRNKNIIHTSKDWNEITEKLLKGKDLDYSPMIHDPDGWDRKNFNFSWEQEKISLHEFKKRLESSTVNINKLKKFEDLLR